MVEVEVLQRFDLREVGGADPHHGALGLPVSDLALKQGRQILLVGPVRIAGLGGQVLPAGADGGSFRTRVRWAIMDGKPSFGAAAMVVPVVIYHSALVDGCSKSTPNRAS